MVSVRQYPYDLYVLTIESGSINSKGNVVPGTNVWINVSKCRDQKSSGTVAEGIDGNRFDYSAVIYAPKDCPVLNNGVSFEVREGSTVRIKGIVKLFSKDQMHCRIWA